MECDRAFITQFLALALDHTRNTTDLSIGKYLRLPFAVKDIMSWLQQASAFCVDHLQYQECLGGSALNPGNLRNFWTSPRQFETWWKNTVERKAKYNKLRLCAHSPLSGVTDETDSAYLLDKRIIVALVDNIRSHSERHFLAGQSVIQIPVPFPPSYFTKGAISDTVLANDSFDRNCDGGTTMRSTSMVNSCIHDSEPVDYADFGEYTEFVRRISLFCQVKISSCDEYPDDLIPFQGLLWSCGENDVEELFT